MSKRNHKIPEFTNSITLPDCMTISKATAGAASDADVRHLDQENDDAWVIDYDPETDTAYTYCFPSI